MACKRNELDPCHHGGKVSYPESTNIKLKI